MGIAPTSYGQKPHGLCEASKSVELLDSAHRASACGTSLHQTTMMAPRHLETQPTRYTPKRSLHPPATDRATNIAYRDGTTATRHNPTERAPAFHTQQPHPEVHHPDRVIGKDMEPSKRLYIMPKSSSPREICAALGVQQLGQLKFKKIFEPPSTTISRNNENAPCLFFVPIVIDLCCLSMALESSNNETGSSLLHICMDCPLLLMGLHSGDCADAQANVKLPFEAGSAPLVS
ncbi:hypothetical protein Nepgr_007961 [Nepenthes gracilis]|uniref:Uncharacterized protein n=1 Tax=Nepenthes gracilis TaxID=150966 RepID=A0AAD3XJ05_NEPGR|nr:hypothetical protein Nepgr_007961 [Nepenthes gracilis]